MTALMDTVTMRHAKDSEPRAAVAALLRHADEAVRQQGVELLRALPDLSLYGTVLECAHLAPPEVPRDLLFGRNLSGANLRGAVLAHTDLRGACLVGANLRRVDLRGADLRGADLRNADLQGAWLHTTDLRGADLRGARIRPPRFAIWRYDSETKLPERFYLATGSFVKRGGLIQKK
tara:strand:- start:163 stop:693 length:531 start_codon:yes stop_codon:yes gene_type:complete